MPQWAGSCWYYLRFVDPKNDDGAVVSPEAERYWMPVDLYVGGVEHAVLHLLYARFWHKVLFDLGLVSTKEPFQKLRNQGMILAASFQDAAGKYYFPHEVEETTPGSGEWRVKTNGVSLHAQVEKMSKSRYNVVNPDDIVRDYGADATRLYECFIGPMEASGVWQTNGVEGVSRFLARAWRLYFVTPPGESVDVLNPALVEGPGTPQDIELERLLHKTIQKVTDDLNSFSFNTAISSMMIFVNAATGRDRLPRAVLETFVLLMAPFAPHFAEEVWAACGHRDSISHASWPVHDPALVADDELEIPVQVNGKVRDTIWVASSADSASYQRIALASERYRRQWMARLPRKVIVKPRQIVKVILSPR